MLDLKAVRLRAATRASVATPANPANWLILDASDTRECVANPANRLTQSPPISRLATLAKVSGPEAEAQSLAEAPAAAINRACDVRGDDAVNRAGLLAECAALPTEGQADMLAHFTLEAVRR